MKIYMLWAKLFDYVWAKVQLHGERYSPPKSYLDAYRLKGGTEDPDKQYYVFRWILPDYALFSVGLKMLMAFEWAEKNGLIPIVDIEYERVYANGELGVDNMWEYCFKQPCSPANVNRKKNVIVGPVIHNISNWKFLRETCVKVNGKMDDMYIHAESDIYSCKEYYHLLNTMSSKIWTIQPNILNKINDVSKHLFSQTRVLGVSLREDFNFGTDQKGSAAARVYRKHPASLSIQEICLLIQDFKSKWDFTHIFVSTIYEDSIEELQRIFGDKILFIDRKRKRIAEALNQIELTWQAVASGNVDDVMENSTAIVSTGEQTNSYIQEVFLLSRCQYLIGAKCSGTMAACLINDGQYDDTYIIPDKRNSVKY